jgi:hypothetical protein
MKHLLQFWMINDLALKSIKTLESVSCILVRRVLLYACISKYLDFILSPFLCIYVQKPSYSLLEKDDDLVTHTCLQHCTEVPLFHQLCQFVTTIHTSMG